MSKSHLMDRRAFIRRVGVAFAGAAALPLLQACAPVGPSAPKANATGTSARMRLPTYVPFEGPKPDFAPSSDGIVPPGYLSYPKQLVKTTSGPVGKGESVSFLTYTLNPPPPALEHNAAWQNLNKKLSVNLTWNTVSAIDWQNKLSVVIASNDFPDMFTINNLGQWIPNELEFLKANCQDLTPFLAGDAIKDYPNLANFPPVAWRNTVFDNKIYALPRLNQSVGQCMLVKQNILDEMGVKSIDTADQFLQVLKDITQTYKIAGFGGGPVTAGHLGWTGGLFGTPNNWRNNGGTFMRSWETPELKEAVAFMRQEWDAGVVYSDSPNWSGPQGAQTFYASKMATYSPQFSSYSIVWDRLLTIDKTFRLNTIPAFGAHGNKPTNPQSAGISSLTVLKKASADRVRLLLKVLNYLAAPFGSEEYQDVYSGVEGADFNFDANGNAVLTQQGVQEVQYSPWTTIIDPYLPLYDPNDPKFVAQAHPQMMKAHDIGLTDPTVGLYSSTQVARGATLDQAMYDAVNNIVFGRSPVSSLDEAVAGWRKNGGDTIKAEYAQAAAQP